MATWSLRERAVWRRPAAGSDQLGEPGLDMHVDVLERRILADSDPGIFVLDPLQPLGDGRGVGLGDDPLGLEHRDMGERGGDVLAPQPLVEADRGVDLAHQRRRPAGEAAAPHQVAAGFVVGDGGSPSGAAIGQSQGRPSLPPHAKHGEGDHPKGGGGVT